MIRKGNRSVNLVAAVLKEPFRPLEKEEIRTHVHSHFKSYFHVHKDTVASNESGNHPTDLPENHRRTVVKDGGMDA